MPALKEHVNSKRGGETNAVRIKYYLDSSACFSWQIFARQERWITCRKAIWS